MLFPIAANFSRIVSRARRKEATFGTSTTRMVSRLRLPKRRRAAFGSRWRIPRRRVDVSIGAVSSLWDFVEGIKPDDEVIQEAVKHVDYRTISVDGTTVTLADPDAMLDLGGIAKGFITDDLASMLREAGCESAMLSLGGNVYVLGESFRGDDWSVGVQDPNGAANDVIASIPAHDKSLVTSGLYERSFVVDDVLYYHILDPRTGYPVKTDLASASIVSDSSTDGDAYSTMLDFLNADERFSGLLVDMNDVATASDGSDFTLLND